MEIFITQNHEKTGPFSPQEIHAGLASGKYQNSDLIWYHGLENWIPLSQASDIFSPNHSTYPSQPVTCGLATASMILGISGFIFIITAIPAVVLGHIAYGKIKKSQGKLGGSGLAIAGIITGYLGIGILLIAILAALTAPMIIKQTKRADRTEAISNAKQIGFALHEFREEYGNYPNEQTAKLVADKTGNPVLTGDSSNARFRQLFNPATFSSEEIFYAKTPYTRRPDGNIFGNEALAPNECAFAYVDHHPEVSADPRPIVMAPFLPGTNEFDPEPFDGKAIILWTDMSVLTYPIDRTTGVVIIDGKSILDPSHPIWAGTPPNILLPEQF